MDLGSLSVYLRFLSEAPGHADDARIVELASGVRGPLLHLEPWLTRAPFLERS